MLLDILVRANRTPGIGPALASVRDGNEAGRIDIVGHRHRATAFLRMRSPAGGALLERDIGG